tara:strand:- start:62 stop:202 length:141 start_codon:yes stop_codon:yes gene_type:complete
MELRMMRSLFLIDAGVMPPASGKGKEDARFEKRGDTGNGNVVRRAS